MKWEPGEGEPGRACEYRGLRARGKGLLSDHSPCSDPVPVEGDAEAPALRMQEVTGVGFLGE